MHAYKLVSHTLANVTLPVTCTVDFSVAFRSCRHIQSATPLNFHFKERGRVHYVGVLHNYTSLKREPYP